MITVTGAAMVLATLPSIKQGLSFSLAASEVTKTSRAGEQLALVGAILTRSQSWRSRSSPTGSSVQPLWVRASRNNWSRADSAILSDIKGDLSFDCGMKYGGPTLGHLCCSAEEGKITS